MDEIAELIGAKPNLWQLGKRDWGLALRCFFGPCLPAQYRLQGPGAWHGASSAIRYQFIHAYRQTDTNILYTMQHCFGSHNEDKSMENIIFRSCFDNCVAGTKRRRVWPQQRKKNSSDIFLSRAKLHIKEFCIAFLFCLVMLFLYRMCF